MLKELRAAGVELMVYPAPLIETVESGLPFLSAIHDVQHRLQPNFREVSAHRQFEMREYIFRNIARYAVLILADSQVGREDILAFYEQHGATADRIKVLPFLPAPYLSTPLAQAERARIRRSYNLPKAYFFYPANFWPHKNHAVIVEAIGKLKSETGLTIHIVFTGASTDHLALEVAARVSQIARDFGVEDAIHQLGHVPNSDMGALYAEARGLVMPTSFGPTNIPIVEAWTLDCPVLTSDIRGIREQVGDAGLLVAPTSVEQLAGAMSQLWRDENLRRELRKRGRRRLYLYQPEDYRRRLNEIVEEAKTRVMSGRKV